MRSPLSPFGRWFGDRHGHTLRAGAQGVSQNGKLKDESLGPAGPVQKCRTWDFHFRVYGGCIHGLPCHLGHKSFEVTVALQLTAVALKEFPHHHVTHVKSDVAWPESLRDLLSLIE
jgi:hypothetical protein